MDIHRLHGICFLVNYIGRVIYFLKGGAHIAQFQFLSAQHHTQTLLMRFDYEQVDS